MKALVSILILIYVVGLIAAVTLGRPAPPGRVVESKLWVGGPPGTEGRYYLISPPCSLRVDRELYLETEVGDRVPGEWEGGCGCR